MDKMHSHNEEEKEVHAKLGELLMGMEEIMDLEQVHLMENDDSRIQGSIYFDIIKNNIIKDVDFGNIKTQSTDIKDRQRQLIDLKQF